jgi:hypothetical protein
VQVKISAYQNESALQIPEAQPSRDLREVLQIPEVKPSRGLKEVLQLLEEEEPSRYLKEVLRVLDEGHNKVALHIQHAPRKELRILETCDNIVGAEWG